MSTQQILDKHYNAEIEQELALGGIIYKHYINGNWFILYE